MNINYLYISVLFYNAVKIYLLFNVHGIFLQLRIFQACLFAALRKLTSKFTIHS